MWKSRGKKLAWNSILQKLRSWHESHHFMANIGETMKTVRYFILGGSKITANDDCSHEINRCLLLGRKAMTYLDSILRSRDITLPTKVHLVSSVQSLSHVQLFVIPWTAAGQASLSITNSRSLSKLMSIESVMPCNHLILCRPLLLPPSIFPSIRVFSSESVQSIGVSASASVLPMNSQS